MPNSDKQKAITTADYPAAFVTHQPEAATLFGHRPTLTLLHQDATSRPSFHEAGVYIAHDNALIVTSNQFADPATRAPRIQITRVLLPPSPDPDQPDNNNSNSNSQQQSPIRCQEISSDQIVMPNGAVNYRSGILFCAQGAPGSPGGLVWLPDARPPYRPARRLLSSFHGRDFNSPNDVVVHSDGSIWFTDPHYGFEQGIRPRPRLPSQIYRFDPADDPDPGAGHGPVSPDARRPSVRAVADGFGKPNGICFSPDELVLYVTDTDWIRGDGSTDDTRVSHIYAFDVAQYGSQPCLINRRLFAMADTGVPDGIKCDVHGNVYSGCGDGVNIWSPGGVLLGKILVDGGVANFCFGRAGALYMLNEQRLWRAQLASSTKGALLGI